VVREFEIDMGKSPKKKKSPKKAATKKAKASIASKLKNASSPKVTKTKTTKKTPDDKARKNVPKSTASKSSAKKKAVESGEQAQSKSPAEFFADNQAIAGFDNPGKSLYTTLRELIENSLDACESQRILPNISVKVEEMTQTQFNTWRSLVQEFNTNNKSKAKDVVDSDAESDNYLDEEESTIKQSIKSTLKIKCKSQFDLERVFHGTEWLQLCPKEEPRKEPETQDSEEAEKVSKKRKRSSVGTAVESRFFRVSVCDNGCGMSHDGIPQMLGRVLSSSKYGVRQTRGKFGLGAKMALIWSKKSTGVPIFVKSKKASEGLSTCVLDIDIYKNEPRILLHTLSSDPTEWKEFGEHLGCDDVVSGTEMSLVIGGNWRTYKAKIVQYLHQLAVITPYAKFKLSYVDLTSEGSTRDMTVRYDRRSDQMPEPAKEVKHHPSSVNNLILQRLLEKTKAKTLQSFLTKELSGISPAAAKKFCETSILDTLKLTPETPPKSLHDGQVTRLVQLLKQQSTAESSPFRSPDASCLSPLGEYNLNLGIRKVIEPDYVATARDRPSAHEGHPFLVEAAVSLGGKDIKEGITVTRFANRIPLLFEGGADVVTRVANTKIKWNLYKMDQKRDKIGVFVSIVSTKIPFKGTGKEVRELEIRLFLALI